MRANLLIIDPGQRTLGSGRQELPGLLDSLYSARMDTMGSTFVAFRAGR